MRRVLIVLSIAFAGLVSLYSGRMVRFGSALTRADPYPTFMADYQSRRSQSYELAKRNFSDFVAETFPIGSDENDAIAKITKGGFRVATSGLDMMSLSGTATRGPVASDIRSLSGVTPVAGSKRSVASFARYAYRHREVAATSRIVCSWPVPDLPGGADDVRSRGILEACNPRNDRSPVTH
jgi:hypothetical protein